MSRTPWLIALTISAPIASTLGIFLMIALTGNRLLGMVAGSLLGFILNWSVFPYKFWRPFNSRKIFLSFMAIVFTYALAFIFESLGIKPFHDSYNEKNFMFSIMFGPPVFFELASRFLLPPVVHTSAS